ncbi:MAG: arsinothricin resistance N-acetyltransferase ArsN1 family B [Pseudohongiellaceae bacterium]
MQIRQVMSQDAQQICSIYNWYIENTTITFEESAVTEEQMQQRIQGASSQRPWLVLQDRDRILGYAYASEWKSRCSYRYSVETTVYIDKDCRGKGIGPMLYEKLILALRETGIHALIAGIALPNDHSVALHEKLGFEKVAQFRQVGWKFNQWIDVGYWQLTLDDQSR